MRLVLNLAFLFFIGSILGWNFEVVFRKFFSSSNPEHKWINPGFCVGPYLPIYGCGLCVLFLLARAGQLLNLNQWVIFICMAISMTLIEYFGGLYFLKTMNLRLWDYRDDWGNIDGLICPLFSFFWAVLGAIYYFLVHPYILDALNWLTNNITFLFVVGFFFGVFSVDMGYSSGVVKKIKKFAKENNIVVYLENIKLHIKNLSEEVHQKNYFFFPYKSKFELPEILESLKVKMEDKIKEIRH